MARKMRIAPGGLAYHVMNRCGEQNKLFEDAGDYEAFEKVLAQALERQKTMRLCAYCLMPNHFHLVLWPQLDGELSKFMQWVTMTHAQRWHAHRNNVGRGHLYQGRFKAFAVQEDAHFLSVCRYVERNALRANLVQRAEQWSFHSLWVRANKDGALKSALAAWPVQMPRDWIGRVNEAQNEDELSALRCAGDRGRPYGRDDWAHAVAARLGIESSLRCIGRPQTPAKK